MPETTAYREEQFDASYPEGVGSHFWNLARNQVVRRKLRGPDGARPVVLDVGCGRGATVEFLRAAGIECLGVELARTSVAEALRPYVSVGIEATDLPVATRETIGTILLLDVLEHVREAEAMLRRLRQAFPRLRRLVATVPARQELWSNYDEFFGHQRRYDLVELGLLLEALEPSELTVGYFFHALYLVVAAQKWLVGRRTVTVRPPRPRFLHRALAQCFSREAELLPGAWPGSSAWAVAELPLR